MNRTVTIHHELANPFDADGQDRMFIFDAEIVDPLNNTNVTWDDSVDPETPVYVISIEPSEDRAPYVDALAALGIEVADSESGDDWTGTQTRPLPL